VAPFAWAPVRPNMLIMPKSASGYSKLLRKIYKILHNIYDPEVSTGILKLSSLTNTRGHPLKLCAQLSRLEIRKNCFAVRVVKV